MDENAARERPAAACGRAVHMPLERTFVTASVVDLLPSSPYESVIIINYNYTYIYRVLSIAWSIVAT